MDRQNRLEVFLVKHKESVSQRIREADRATFRAQILQPQQIALAAKRIKQGGLVAFPTETVYGLGASAFNELALRRIYEVKKRPLTDPIIVHVLDEQQALSLVVATEEERELFTLLTKRFWPGPLTVILKANLSLLPMMVTAQTGYVGVRAPKHSYARELITASGVPIGAPSANLFSHVSPTEPVHVFNDFYQEQICIVDGERCEYGVESTVVKLVGNEVHVLREGSLLVPKLQVFLEDSMGNKCPKVVVAHKILSKETNMQAPGQLLKHYAPNLPCFYFTDNSLANPCFSVHDSHSGQPRKYYLSEAAVISFNHEHFARYAGTAKHYYEIGQELGQGSEEWQQEGDMFCPQEEKVRMREIYYLLRKCENLPVECILVGWIGEHSGTLWDKVFRATQGILASVSLTN